MNISDSTQMVCNQCKKEAKFIVENAYGYIEFACGNCMKKLHNKKCVNGVNYVTSFDIIGVDKGKKKKRK